MFGVFPYIICIESKGFAYFSIYNDLSCYQKVRYFMIYWHPMVILRREIPMMQKIKKDERWLESEKRGYDVGEQDPLVEKYVCEVIQKVGETMRHEAEELLYQVTRVEYRLVKHQKPSKEEVLTVHRVFCEEDGRVCGVCASPYIPCGENPQDITSQLELMSKAVSSPVLLEEDFSFADWSMAMNLLPGR